MDKLFDTQIVVTFPAYHKFLKFWTEEISEERKLKVKNVLTLQNVLTGILEARNLDDDEYITSEIMAAMKKSFLLPFLFDEDKFESEYKYFTEFYEELIKKIY